MIRKHDRIYTPDEYEELCAQSSNNFHITKLLTSDIKDFDSWWKEYYTKHPVARECRGRSVPKEAKFKSAPTRYKEFRYNSEEKGLITAYIFIEGLQKHIYQLLRPAFRNVDIDFPSSIAVYPSGKVPINIKKMEDIKKMIVHIPENFKVFYDELFTWPTNEHDNDTIVENDLF